MDTDLDLSLPYFLQVYGTILTYVILVVKFGMSKKGGVSVFSKDIMDRLTGSNNTVVN